MYKTLPEIIEIDKCMRLVKSSPRLSSIKLMLTRQSKQIMARQPRLIFVVINAMQTHTMMKTFEERKSAAKSNLDVIAEMQ